MKKRLSLLLTLIPQLVFGQAAIFDGSTVKIRKPTFRIIESGSGGQVFNLGVPALAGDVSWTLPNANASGVLSNNGSGALSWAADVGFADPMTTRGDLIFRNSSNVTARLGIGAANTVLRTDGTDAAWGKVALATDVSGVTPIANSTISTQTIASTDIDWATGSLFVQTLPSNRTFTFSNRTSGQTITVRLTNTASNYTVTWPTVKWPGGVTHVMTTGAKSDVCTFAYDGSDTYGSCIQNF